jgi:hypothetical protein
MYSSSEAYGLACPFSGRDAGVARPAVLPAGRHPGPPGLGALPRTADAIPLPRSALPPWNRRPGDSRHAATIAHPAPPVSTREAIRATAERRRYGTRVDAAESAALPWCRRDARVARPAVLPAGRHPGPLGLGAPRRRVSHGSPSAATRKLIANPRRGTDPEKRSPAWEPAMQPERPTRRLYVWCRRSGCEPRK